MACGFGACFGCAVPLAGRRLHAPLRRRAGGPRRRDRDGAGRRAADTGERGLGRRHLLDRALRHQLAHPVINGSGTFDAIAARRAFGDAAARRLPFSAFVSKTITPEPRAGQPAAAALGDPGGMINSIGLPNKGLDGFLDQDLPELAELPVPLIVSVMGTSREEFARLVERRRRPRRGGRDRAERLLPEREVGPDRRRAAGGDRGAAGGAAAADREAADREADAERRRPRRGRGGGARRAGRTRSR